MNLRTLLRVVAALVLGCGLYWLVETVLLKIDSLSSNMVAVLFSPITIFGWIGCLALIVAVYIGLRWLDHRVSVGGKMILYKIHHKQRRAKVRVGQRALMVGVIVCAMVLPGAWRVIRTPIFTDVDSDDGLTNRLLDAVVSQIDHSHDFVLTSHRDERALFLGVSAATSHRVGKRGLVSATIGISRGFSDHAPTRVMKVTCWDEELRNCALAALKFASSMTKEGRVISAPVIEALLRTNAEIESALRNETPSRVVSRMWSSGHWDAFTGRISSGDRAAIALVPEVAKGTDAGASEDLGISLAEALVKAPDAVLPVLELAPNRTLSVGFVCSAPFIEDSNAHQRAYKAKALKAVTLARLNPSLVRQGQTCIEKLKQIELHD